MVRTMTSLLPGRRQRRCREGAGRGGSARQRGRRVPGAGAARRVDGPQLRLGGAHVRGAGPLGALLDVELDALAPGEAVEVERSVQAAAMEEVLLLILGDAFVLK